MQGKMEIIHLTLCGLIFLHTTLEESQSTGFTQDSTNLGIWTPERLRRESPFAWDTTPEVTTKDVMQEATTQEPPTTEGRMNVEATPESPTTEGGMNVEATLQSPTTEEGMNVEATLESPTTEGGMNVEATLQSPTTEGGMNVEATLQSPTTEGGMNVEATLQSPTTEGGMNVEATLESHTPEGGMHVDVTQESPTAEGRMNVEVTQESSSQEDTFREIFNNSTLTPYTWLCAREGKYSIKVHCKCDPVCVLYGDCCYGVTENATVCAASVRLRGTHDAMQPATVPGTNVTETQSDSTNSTASPNKTSSIRGKKQEDPVSISLAHKSSCRRSPTLHRKKRQTRLPYLDTLGLQYWMVDRCPSSWQEKYSRIKCTDISNTSLTEDALLYQPVTDSDTMITFRNKYCAACNGIKGGGEPWDFVVYSTRNVPLDFFANCSSSDCVLKKLKDKGGNVIFEPKPEWNLRTCFREVEDDVFGPCKFSVVNGSVRRVPRPLPLHSALRDACMAYNNPVVLSGFENSNKNYHCMLCYLGDFLLCEDQNFTLPPERHFGLSLRALLYLGDQDKEQSDDVMTRPVDQQQVCPPGFVPDGQDCRPFLYNFTVMRSPVFLHFEPCGWVPTPRDGCRDIIRDGRLAAVLRAMQARFHSCVNKRGVDNTSITFVVETMVTLRVRLAHYEEGRNMFDQVQAWMENALQNVQLKISGGPVGIRLGSFSACIKNAMIHTSVPPSYGRTTLSTPKQGQGNSHVGNVTLLMLMALVAAVWDI